MNEFGSGSVESSVAQPATEVSTGLGAETASESAFAPAPETTFESTPTEIPPVPEMTEFSEPESSFAFEDSAEVFPEAPPVEPDSDGLEMQATEPTGEVAEEDPIPPPPEMDELSLREPMVASDNADALVPEAPVELEADRQATEPAEAATDTAAANDETPLPPEMEEVPEPEPIAASEDEGNTITEAPIAEQEGGGQEPLAAEAAAETAANGARLPESSEMEEPAIVKVSEGGTLASEQEGDGQKIEANETANEPSAEKDQLLAGAGKELVKAESTEAAGEQQQSNPDTPNLEATSMDAGSSTDRSASKDASIVDSKWRPVERQVLENSGDSQFRTERHTVTYAEGDQYEKARDSSEGRRADRAARGTMFAETGMAAGHVHAASEGVDPSDLKNITPQNAIQNEGGGTWYQAERARDAMKEQNPELKSHVDVTYAPGREGYGDEVPLYRKMIFEQPDGTETGNDVIYLNSESSATRRAAELGAQGESLALGEAMQLTAFDRENIKGTQKGMDAKELANQQAEWSKLKEDFNDKNLDSTEREELSNRLRDRVV